jgi:hypothetical protein
MTESHSDDFNVIIYENADIDKSINQLMDEKRDVLTSYAAYNKSKQGYKNYKELNDALKERHEGLIMYPSYTLLICWGLMFFVLLLTVVFNIIEGDLKMNSITKVILFIMCVYIFSIIIKNMYGHFNK